MTKTPSDDIPASQIYFGKAASGYDVGRSGNPVTDVDDEAIRAFLTSLPPGSVVADAPCGTGRALPAVLAAGHKYRGADVSIDMLGECRMKVPAGAPVELAEADARHLPWEDGSCDALLSFKFLKWLPSDDLVLQVMKEYRRVCRGRALVNIKLVRETSDYSLRELVDRLAKIRDRIVLGGAARSVKRANFESICSKAGWKIVSVDENSASNGIVHNFTLE